jgi:cyclase
MTNSSSALGSNVRLIARLDIKGENLIKGIQLEGLRVIGPPNEYALKYYLQGADELIYMDCVASLYGRNHLSDIITAATKNIFVPITVGGGIRSVNDAFNILRAGADKVAINTAAVANPSLIENISRQFGSQCMVLSVEAKKVNDNKWEVYTDNGREKTGMDVVDWVKQGIDLGAGEILLTSVDKEGTGKGFDTSLVRSVTEQSMVPVIASGGMGSPEDLLEAINEGASAVAMADILHYGRSNINEVRKTARRAGFGVREYFSE